MAIAKSKEKSSPRAKRDPAATKERILKAGLAEFGSKGYGGASMETVVKRAKCNIRMIYHYFGGKQNLYVACLERVYSHIRAEEQKLNLEQLPPVKALEQLVDFTFDHMQNNPDFVKIAVVENMQRGKYIGSVTPVARAAAGLIDTIETILKRGVRQKVLRSGIDAFQLYVSILSLSYLHLSNRHTLSITYGQDLSDPKWLEARRKHVRNMILSYVRAPG
ncbi:MAG: TetR family transcriptional regulator [Alphaproteobacteria bacterium]|nr:TetR family transcriptional regulator [Alphaproteobacteria bacterium]